MPHLTLHYTANLAGFDADAALAAINRVLADSGHFDEASIKSRALRLEHYRIGTAGAGRGFVHAQLRILPGRDAATRAALSQAVLDGLRDLLPASAGAAEFQLCVEVDDIAADAYRKHVLAPDLP